jgi:hypothetical protein
MHFTNAEYMDPQTQSTEQYLLLCPESAHLTVASACWHQSVK